MYIRKYLIDFQLLIFIFKVKLNLKVRKNNPYHTLKKLFETGNIEDYEEFFNEFGKTNIQKVTGISYPKVLKTLNEPDILSLRNIIELSKEVEVDPRKIAILILDTVEKNQKSKKK